MVGAWLTYAVRLTRQFYFWSDDLRIIEQSRSWTGILKPYDGALTVPTLLIDRVSAEFAHLSYTPFIVSGAVFLVAAPIAFFFTARRELGPPLAAILALVPLWYDGVSLRQAGLNHYCGLVGAILCGAALNRGRRADIVLFAGLLIAVSSGGLGLVVILVCIAHNALTRAPLRRWITVLVPTALFALWLVAYGSLASARNTLSLTDKVDIVRDFFLAPFYQAGFDFWPLAVVLLIAFFAWGILRLRQGLKAGANFIVWTLAMVAWPIGLIHSRGATATVGTFRYAYVSLGFALLAVVPCRPLRWPQSWSVDRSRILIAGALVVVLFGGIRALDARSSLQASARQSTDSGRKAKATMLVLQLGPSVIPDSTPLRFFGFNNRHGTAGQLRALMKRYHSALAATVEDIDQQIVDVRAATVEDGAPRKNVTCAPLTNPIDVVPTSIGEAALGRSPPAAPAPGPWLYRLWAPKATAIQVRRFGDRWVRLGSVPARHTVYLTLSVLASEKPWTIRADGACIVP
jgi:hypothetical protein